MPKKEERMNDGGKSIIHVKNSAGGFYKVKKTGRLGKNCIYFSGSGRCKKLGKWCNSSTCFLYKRKK